MANTAAPFGFRQLRRLDGGAPTAGFEKFTINSTDANLYFTGDPVAGGTDGNITTASSQSIIKGIFMGCEYYSAATNRIIQSPNFPGLTGSAGTTVDCFVCTDPDMLYIAQVATSAGTIGSSRIGENISFTSAVSSLGNALSGISVVTLSSDIATTAAFPFRLYDLYSRYAPPGTNGTDNASAGQILVVAPNNFERNNTTGI
jgi:hypothetical protein